MVEDRLDDGVFESRLMKVEKFWQITREVGRAALSRGNQKNFELSHGV